MLRIDDDELATMSDGFLDVFVASIAVSMLCAFVWGLVSLFSLS